MNKILGGVIVLLIIIVGYYLFFQYGLGRSEEKIPPCLKQPEKPYVFCEYFEPKIDVVRKRVSIELNFSRKITANQTFLTIYSYLDNLTASGIELKTTGQQYMYIANVTSKKILNIKIEGNRPEEISPVVYRRKLLLLDNFIMIVQHSCMNGKCEEYEIFK